MGAATVSGVLAPTVAEAAVACGQTITTSMTLTSDLTCTGNGIFVNAPGVILDLGGHTITGPAPSGGSTRGVVATSNRPNIVIRNGTVRGFDLGVDVDPGANGSLVTGVTMDANGLGLRTNTGVSNVRATRNTITNTSRFSAVQLGGNGNRVDTNVLTDGAFSGVFFSGNNDVITANLITGMGGRGVSLDAFPSSPGPFTNNQITANNISGSARLTTSSSIAITNGSGTLVKDNAVDGRLTTPGVFVNESAGTTVSGNYLTHNSAGVLVRGAGSTNTLVTANYATTNRFGIQVEAAPTGTTLTLNNASANTPFDGILVQSPSATVASNTANSNGNWGINAVAGVTDGGGNKASGNVRPAQCTANIVCT
jgi:hypothetical protein